MTLKQFMSRSLTDKIGMFIVALIALCAGLFVWFKFSVLGVPAICLLISIGLFIEVFTSTKRLNKAIAQMSKIGMYQEAEKEFKDAREFAKGNLKLSRTFIFRRNTHEILMYRNIQTVGLFTDEQTDRNGVKVTLYNNEERILCGCPTAEANEVISLILKYGPRIQRKSTEETVLKSN